jgi:hypothetical protein
LEKTKNAIVPQIMKEQINIISPAVKEGIKNLVSKENNHDNMPPANTDIIAEIQVDLYIGSISVFLKKGKNLKFGVCQLLRESIRRE